MLVVLYSTLQLLTSIPAFQAKGADVASQLLRKKIGSKVSIEKLRLNMLGHVILDNVKLYDRRDTLMLQASRIAAKVDLLPLVEKKIRISGAQLIGAKAKLYKDGEEPCNFQFLVDAFSKKDSIHSPIDLGISALVVRRGDIRFDFLDVPTTPGRFNPYHIHLNKLSMTARILSHMPDTFAIDLRQFSCIEQSGFSLQQFSFKGKAGQHSATIQDLMLTLPETNIHGHCSMSNVSIQNIFLGKGFEEAGLEGVILGSVCPRDLQCLVPRLATFSDNINFSSEIRMQDGTLHLPNLSVSDYFSNFSLLCDTKASNLRYNPVVHANIKELHTGPSLQQFLTQNLRGQANEISPILTRLGSTISSGNIAFRDHNIYTDFVTESEQGAVFVDATLYNMKEVEADIVATDIKLGHLLNLSGENGSTELSLEASASGTLPGKDRQARLSLSGLLNSLTYKDYEHRNMMFSANMNGEAIEGNVTMDEPNGHALFSLQTTKQQGKRSLVCQAKLTDFAPNLMNLTKRYAGERFTASLDADFSDLNPENLQGKLRLTNLKIASEEDGILEVGDIVLNSDVTENGQNMIVQSDFLNVEARGNINWKTLPASFMQPIRNSLPSLFLKGESHIQPSGNNFLFHVHVQDTVLTERLLDSDFTFSLPENSILEGSINDAIGQIALQLRIPKLLIGGQQFQNIGCRAESGKASLQTSFQCERFRNGKPIELNLDAYATNDKVTSNLHWDNKRNITYKGNIKLTGNIHRNHLGKPVIDATIDESPIVIGDTVWHLKPASISYHDKVIDVEGLSVSHEKRHANIGGRISKLDSDTLNIELADIDIAYIMDLVNFHKVDFDGRATGNIYATSLMKKPFADAFLQVKEFTFNEAELGDMDLYANWGKKERAVLLEASMKDPDIEGVTPQSRHWTLVYGTIIPGKGAQDGLNLNIHTNRINLFFLNKYTKGIFRDLQGRASGWALVYGPFKKINLKGDLLIDEMKMHVMVLGTDYHLAGDSVSMRPDNIWIRGAHVYDNLGKPGVEEHMAYVDVHLMHDAFKNMRYDIDIDAHNLLGYNFPHQGSMNFFGTAYCDGKVKLNGKPGTVNIDVAVTPKPGTVINYNVATSGAASEKELVTYEAFNSRQTSRGEKKESTTPEPDAEGSADIRINFNINANPDAQIRILMDPRSGDNIALNGYGALKANFYNKGRFQLFGTYRVSEGNYRMSIHDLIRKDFTFEPGGVIVFGGDPMRATLNLKAKHIVPNVSLDDLSTTGLGLSNTRVDCIMNLGGLAKEPVVSFDFDIPNANEEEKQMVRSMLSSKEERDMQVVYLLGVGRFYDYGGASALLSRKQGQGGRAMNSVLSNTITSRFNQIMSKALGGTGWTFGTNLRTGEVGWERLDVEGLISGKMLSGRLIFNGNFGYRENKNRTGKGNFIGDFEIQYRLSQHSPFILKAYNQANDRYFTQSSLNTQGIGIKFQRDFNRFKELFLRTKRKKKKE